MLYYNIPQYDFSQVKEIKIEGIKGTPSSFILH